MAKTKDAFALRDFNRQKILSRSFFDTATLFFRKETSKSGTFELSRITKKYETDTSILFNFLLADNISDKEVDYSNLRTINLKVSEYRRHIQRHCKKIDELYKKVGVEVANITILSIENNSVSKTKEKRFEELKPKVRRLKYLQEKYKDVLNWVDLLQQEILEKIEVLKHDIENVYEKNFSENLKQLRKETGLTQAVFSAICGISRSDLALFESGKKIPSFTTLCRIINSPFGNGDLLKLN